MAASIARRPRGPPVQPNCLQGSIKRKSTAWIGSSPALRFPKNPAPDLLPPPRCPRSCLSAEPSSVRRAVLYAAHRNLGRNRTSATPQAPA